MKQVKKLPVPEVTRSNAKTLGKLIVVSVGAQFKVVHTNSTPADFATAPLRTAREVVAMLRAPVARLNSNLSVLI